MSFATILRRSLPTWLVWAVPLAAAAPAAWQTHAPLPEPRTEVAAGVARGEIVVVGGLTAGGGNSPRVDAYSTIRNTWRRLPDLPVAPQPHEGTSGDDRVRLRPCLRAADEALAPPADPAARARGRLGGRSSRRVAGAPQPGLTVSGAVESIAIR